MATHVLNMRADALLLVQQFKAQRGRPRGDLPAIVAALGLEQRVLNQPWVELSVSHCRNLIMLLCCSLGSGLQALHA